MGVVEVEGVEVLFFGSGGGDFHFCRGDVEVRGDGELGYFTGGVRLVGMATDAEDQNGVMRLARRHGCVA